MAAARRCQRVMTSSDPVSDPGAYQRLLLDLLADDDPATVKEGTAAALVQQLVEQAGADLRTRPAPAEWSVVELVGHVTDAEMVSSGRYRWILAHDTPSIPSYDQDRWTERLRHREVDVAGHLALFTALRTANLALWRRTPAAERSRYGHRGSARYSILRGRDRHGA